MKVLVTGAAGFIGAHVCRRLLAGRGCRVTGTDDLNPYYDPRLKRHRLDGLRRLRGFRFVRSDVRDTRSLAGIFEASRPDAVVHLAAMPGVRASLARPAAYYGVNTAGALTVLEQCRRSGVRKVVVASTSSVYAGLAGPFSEAAAVATPANPYAASKAAAEEACAFYGRAYGLDVTVLRYFTVYGPAGRPDMSPFRFIEWVRTGRPIRLNGDGRQERDFTYVEDIAEGTMAALRRPGSAVINLGGNRPVTLTELIRQIERCLGERARVERRPPQPGEMRSTWADIRRARSLLGWRPRTSLEQGIRRTVDWHLAHSRFLDRMRLP